ncbi:MULTISPECIES: thiamine pyrophosphate-binding protein [Lysinibacillus]|uniref:thiamine pyrophosphate-binding protein n=1 Tax=Lysinibacillus TaxID=400634 RepID=UPI0004D37DC3|nr:MULTISPECIES: thiamine pyrophosphate-binding protein [Lysinibacillus]MCK1990077.1 thiamine pyrophosphate-binding protein [Lysinibacillus fusiformis]MCT6816925.1 thiamine pyrophosphate-binding protein [Lysinibacillus fusiformis]MCT6930082.1 thiamine pyrophosphate-binding protein [Lysinibacillus fusiformis]MCT6934761.1 thiamine pyrophosphate-binding protein [Lysinibacillus fusiformis]UXJ68942.1 thiamine pyrophosphate-binding protein [Lysinibacillus fusiformis]
MKAARTVLEYLKNSGVQYIFGIPAGSVNAFFDELNDMSELTPIVTKHEGAASYMAAAYAKYTNHLSVCIGCSGPGGTNLVTGAANAMREHLPVLFLTGAVPVNTIGLNASQELDAEPIFRPVTKYSVTVKESKDLLTEIVKASEIALSGVPGPVHIAIPIDVQHETVPNVEIPAPPKGTAIVPELDTIKRVAEELLARRSGYILVGQGVRNSVEQLLELAEILNWPIITTPQAKGYIPEDHPLLVGVFGFAGHEAASQLIADGDGQVLFIVGSSLGETATNNYNLNLTKNRFSIQLDFDQSVFNRKYEIDLPVLGDIHSSLLLLIEELRAKGLARTSFEVTENKDIYEEDTGEYNTKNVLLTIQKYLPASTRYAIDIGEFMSYVIHHMKVVDYDTFNINVHFGAMGSGIGSAIGSKLAEPERPVACITGDGCFFMHGMEILTAKEYNLPILFIVMNNARLGMVYHGHALQFKRTHPSFEQHPINISAMASAMDIPSFQVTELQDLNQDMLHNLMNLKGPAVLEVVLTDNNTPPMGDRVKFLSSFGK